MLMVTTKIMIQTAVTAIVDRYAFENITMAVKQTFAYITVHAHQLLDTVVTAQSLYIHDQSTRRCYEYL
jgi:hypothetical protein